MDEELLLLVDELEELELELLDEELLELELVLLEDEELLELELDDDANDQQH